jgi:hypothetical protein
MDLKESGRVDPNKFWYYVYKSRYIISRTLKFNDNPKVIFDVGAGSGFFAKEFSKKSLESRVFCIDPFYSQDQLAQEQKISFVLEPPKEKAELLLFVDVLEHVRDDKSLLMEYLDKANSGGIFVITVPAFKSLWSSHDVYLEHFRRYKLEDLRSLVQSVGLVELHSSYIFGSLFPIVWIIRKIKSKRNGAVNSDLQDNSDFVNRMILLYLTIEKIFPFNKYFGTSAFIVAKKRG